jgi:hypothetical protein
MANETNYKFTELLMYREDTQATIPANPSAVEVKGLLNISIKDTQQTETNITVDTDGEAAKKDRGKSSYEGSIECKYMGDMMPVLVTHVLGDPDTIADITSEVWASTTAYTKFNTFDVSSVTGKVVKHSDGTHMLVCYEAGTSGATEPVLTGKSVGDKITDGTVTWILVKNLKRYDGTTQSCLPTAGLEYKATSRCGGTVETFVKRVEGVYLNSLELNKSTGGIIHKYSIPAIGTKATDNTQQGWSSVTAEVGYSVQTMKDFAFKYDEMKVLVNDEEPTDATMFRMTVNRGTTMEDGVAIDTKVSNTPTMTIDGELKLKFTKEQYLSAYDNENFVLKVLLGNARGEVAQFTFNNVEKDRVDPDFTTDRFAEITIPLTASGDATTKSINYTVTSQIDYQ